MRRAYARWRYSQRVLVASLSMSVRVADRPLGTAGRAVSDNAVSLDVIGSWPNPIDSAGKLGRATNANPLELAEYYCCKTMPGSRDSKLDLAIVRNRLLAGKSDTQDDDILEGVLDAAKLDGSRQPLSPYPVILQLAIENAKADIAAGNLECAAREVDLIHNVPIGSAWELADEEYWRASLLDYCESAPLYRVKRFFAAFAVTPS